MAFPHTIFLILLSLALIKVAQAQVKPGTTLKPTDARPYWESPNKNFTIGFYPSTTSDTTEQQVEDDSYHFGIAFASTNTSSSALTLAWNPVPHVKFLARGSSALQFRGNGDLVLLTSDGSVAWTSGTFAKGVTVSAASMRDDGNFVIVGGNRSSVLWQSFQHPYDTLIVGQSLGPGKNLRNGEFSFGIGSVGELALKWHGSVVYWNASSGQTNGSVSVSFSSQGALTLVNSTGSQLWLARSMDYTDESIRVRMIRLDSDGNLRSYGWHDDTQSWQVAWQAVEDQCRVYGWCGNLGICIYKDAAPTCICPSHDFVAVDVKNPTLGCKRLEDLSSCSSNQSMVEVDHTDMLSYPPEVANTTNTNSFFLGLKDCSGNCLKNPTCFASTLLNDGTGRCEFGTSNFSSGYLSLAIPSTAYVKVCGSGQPLNLSSVFKTNVERPSNSKLDKNAIIIAVLGSCFALLIFELGLCWLCWRNNSRLRTLSHQYNLLEYASGAPVQFSYNELQHCTKSFKDKVGSGGFGTVYKGTLSNKTVVAVKRLEGIEQGEKQFRMEVATIGSTHHLNLVKLVGFCSERKHRLLVYEFLKNKSLDRFLFSSADNQSKKLDWNVRFNIALGTARGIAYLHGECRACIIHCDIKPENILLDDNFVAKVSDFGLARLIHTRDCTDRPLSSIRGTRGYLAPEWMANLPLSTKSDVFSYGMVLLEIIIGRRNFDTSEISGKTRFSKWAFEQYQGGDVSRIVDKRLGGNYSEEQVIRAIQVSFWCIQEMPSSRPSMGKVVQMLEGILPIEMPPCPKPFEGIQIFSSSSTSRSTSSALPVPSPLAGTVFEVSDYEPNGGEILSSGR